MKNFALKSIITGILLQVILLQLNAQDVKEIKNLFKKAEEHLLYEAYELALPVYLELLDKGWDNANINFSIGMCYLNSQGQAMQAIPYFEKAVVNVSSNYKEGNYKEERAPEEAWFYLGKAYRIVGSYDKAINAYKQYKDFLPATDYYYQPFLDLQIKNCEIARNMVKNPINFEKTEMDVNQDLDNYSPAVSGDGTCIAFTALQKEVDDFGEFFLQVVYFSEFDGYTWSKPHDISEDIESDGYFKSCYLSYDGTYMLLYRDDYGNGNIYFTQRDGRRWSKVEKLPKQINSKANENHASLSKDGNTMYFSSDRPGGLGGFDIYKSVKDLKGRWGEPVNLGESINTMFEEDTPFLSEDGNTLYFASEAHSSMGGYDIFKSTKDADGNWSEPQNLGYPINTAGDDLFYLPMGDESEAYMAKYPDGGGYQRIYHIEYPRVERVVEVTPENLSVEDNVAMNNNADETHKLEYTNTNTSDNETIATTKPETKTIIVPSEYELKGNITLEDNKDLDASFYVHVTKLDGEVVAALSPNIHTGEFRTSLKNGSYYVKAYGDGYEPAQQMIYISDTEQNPEVITFLKMTPLEVSTGEYYTIKSILFDQNSASLNKDAKIEIEKLAALMNQNSGLQVEVVGNTDSRGTETYNQKLSVQRAKSVVEYIANKGIDASRFVTKGLGESNLIAIDENPDGTENPEGSRLNRRVDIKLINSTNDNITVENIYVPDELKYRDHLMYTILLDESEKALTPDAFNLTDSPINNVWMYKTASAYLYTVGKFNHKSDALDLMNVVVDAGFPDARVISSLEYEQLIQKGAGFYKSKMNADDNKTYTIQLYALKKPLKNSRVNRMTDVTMVKGDDGYYRYIMGEFIGKVSARQALRSAINKGFYDAFIVEMNKFK